LWFLFSPFVRARRICSRNLPKIPRSEVVAEREGGAAPARPVLHDHQEGHPVWVPGPGSPTPRKRRF
jgi:hypothetical protein